MITRGLCEEPRGSEEETEEGGSREALEARPRRRLLEAGRREDADLPLKRPGRSAALPTPWLCTPDLQNRK